MDDKNYLQDYIDTLLTLCRTQRELIDVLQGIKAPANDDLEEYPFQPDPVTVTGFGTFQGKYRPDLVMPFEVNPNLGEYPEWDGGSFKYEVKDE